MIDRNLPIRDFEFAAWKIEDQPIRFLQRMSGWHHGGAGRDLNGEAARRGTNFNLLDTGRGGGWDDANWLGPLRLCAE